MENYDLIETIHEGVNTYIHKALRKDDNESVVIKVLKNKFPTIEEVAKLRYEYDMAKGIELPGVVKYYDFIKYNNVPAIVLEDFGGQSLADLIQKQKLNLEKS